MIFNRTLLKKADLALSDLVSDGGYLQPAQAKKFIELMIRKQKLSGMITVKPLMSPNQLIETIVFSGQVLQPGTSGEALPQALRSKPEFTKKSWDAKLFRAQVNIPAEVLEDNIELGGLRNTIMRLATEGVGRDAEKVMIQGDTTSATPLLAQLNGFLKQVTTNTIDANGSRLDKSLLRQAIRALPKEYIDDKANMRFFTSINAEDDYSDTHAPRATVLGDTVITTQWASVYKGVPVIPVPLFPETLGVSNNETNVLFVHPKNLCQGIWRQIKIRTREDIDADVFVMVVSMRFDAKIIYEPASVKITEVLNS